MGFLCNFGGFVVSDMCVEGGHQHQGIVHVLFDIGFNRFQADSAFVVKADTAFANEAGAVQEVIDHNGFEHVQFKMAGGATDTDGHIVPHYLGGDHGEGLTLGGVHFARHDGGAGLIVGNEQLANTAAGAGGQDADIIGNFHQADGYGLEGAMGFHNSIMSGQGLKFIFGGNKRQAGKAGNMFGYVFGIVGWCVDAGTYGGAAKGQLAEVLQGILNGFQAMGQL